MGMWKVIFDIKGHLSFTEPFSSSGVDFSIIEGKKIATVIVEADEEDEAQKNAQEHVNYVLSGFSFVTGYKAEAIIRSIAETNTTPGLKRGADFLPSTMFVPYKITENDKKSSEEILSYLSRNDKTALIAYNSYLRGVSIEEWNSEAFLHFFKSIEVIANKYIKAAIANNEIITKEEEEVLLIKLKNALSEGEKDTAKKLINQIYKLGLINLKKQIEVAIDDLKLSEIKERVFTLVDLRHEIAHASSKNNIITDEQLQECKELSKKIIIKYLTK
jgi:hypothetical protein